MAAYVPSIWSTVEVEYARKLTCPQCGVEPGLACRTPEQQVVLVPHTERITEARAQLGGGRS